MRRREFQRIKRSELRFSHMELKDFCGYAGILRIMETDGEWQVDGPSGNPVTVAAPGYTWLQLSPDDSQWWLTVMYDTCGKLVQYYFDITGEKYISNDGEPRFQDMFLDIVMQPDGSWRLLDAPELDAALAEGQITLEQFDAAQDMVKRLIAQIDGHEAFWRNLCSELINRI